MHSFRSLYAMKKITSCDTHSRESRSQQTAHVSEVGELFDKAKKKEKQIIAPLFALTINVVSQGFEP